MKVFIILAGLVAGTSAHATLKQLNCGPNERGVTMEVSLTPTEATVPMYEVKMRYAGKVYKKFNAYESTSRASDFQAQGHDDENSDTILYVGFSFRTGEGYHQQAANNGMSPLPGIFFSNCTTR